MSTRKRNIFFSCFFRVCYSRSLQFTATRNSVSIIITVIFVLHLVTQINRGKAFGVRSAWHAFHYSAVVHCYSLFYTSNAILSNCVDEAQHTVSVCICVGWFESPNQFHLYIFIEMEHTRTRVFFSLPPFARTSLFVYRFRLHFIVERHRRRP